MRLGQEATIGYEKWICSSSFHEFFDDSRCVEKRMGKDYLIIVKGNDKTDQIASIEWNEITQKYDICYQTGKVYSYSRRSVEILRSPVLIDPKDVEMIHKGRKLFSIEGIQFFHRENNSGFLHITFADGSERTYAKREVEILRSCLAEDRCASVLNYLKSLSQVSELRGKNGELLLEKQYEKLTFVGEDTALAVYLNPEDHKSKHFEETERIYPFGGNASQFQALDNALNNQLSIIQGPPGTGKTQTILNIIANLLVLNKTVQVVSSNNSATKNVLEKLASPQYALDFLVAPLGSSDNKTAFLEKQPAYPSFVGWNKTAEEQRTLKVSIAKLSQVMRAVYRSQERLAAARLELSSLHTEIQYFKQYCSDQKLSYEGIKVRRTLQADLLIKLWQECDRYCEKERAVSFWFKIKCAYLYGISQWESDITRIVTLLQHLFYQSRLKELECEIASLEKYLKDADAKGKSESLTATSLVYLRAILYERYGGRDERVRFTDEDLWKCPEKVINEYPITLSSTFSSRSSLRGITYDYLIMDEASQVDIATGALALSGARNAVIVGDLQQLPNVIKPKVRKACEQIFARYNLPAGYNYVDNSFLRSICRAVPDIPQTLLREHYRCHPQIIGFCNQKFYQNALIIMTEDRGEKDVLSAYKTVMGNHRRDHLNQRQIDVIISEVIPSLADVEPSDIGIIAPYRDQTAVLSKELGESTGIEVSTVHSFQGREKDAIILTTVDDVVTDFSDDPYLLNVAISRAKKRLKLVVSGNEQPPDSNIQDLISYIEYNNFSVVQGEIYSIFDYLYQQHTEARLSFLRKHLSISKYDSENLMYGMLEDILHQYQELSLGIASHVPLRALFRDTNKMNEEELRYAMHHATHVDFLIYRKIGKIPVLAIEVDGFHNHKPGSAQYERDLKKDHIFQLYGMPLIRFPTNGSGERERVISFLEQYKVSRQ